MVKQLDESNKEEEAYILPGRTGKYSIVYRMPKKENAKKFFLCGILGCIAAWIYWDEKGLKWNGRAAFREDMKNNPDTLQTIRNLVYGNVEMLTREEMRALDIEEPKPLDSEVLKGNEN